jgi:predicted GNAT family N-acyltransferase
MASYTYTKTKDGDQRVFRIYLGSQEVARARLMLPTQNFEAYSVNDRSRGKGLSYALTYAMLVYCSAKDITTPQVSDAHGHLLDALPQVGFQQVGPTRVIKRHQRAASFECVNVEHSITACTHKLAQYNLRLDGPIRQSSACIIL